MVVSKNVRHLLECGRLPGLVRVSENGIPEAYLSTA